MSARGGYMKHLHMRKTKAGQVISSLVGKMEIPWASQLLVMSSNQLKKKLSMLVRCNLHSGQ
jgi:hypothetical protein